MEGNNANNVENKWGKPGWRIEQRFAPGVLIGNWGEERYSFCKGDQKHNTATANSTHRMDFKQYQDFKPDVVVRRKAQFQNNGLPKELLFYHHGNRYSNNMISWYDEHYNKRERDENNKLPDLRTWDSNSLAWVPEKSDFPIQGAPTNFGLKQKLYRKWDIQENESDNPGGDYATTYRKSYTCFPYEAMVKVRAATPKEHSIALHSANKSTRDLCLRNRPVLRAPEVLPNARLATMMTVQTS